MNLLKKIFCSILSVTLIATPLSSISSKAILKESEYHFEEENWVTDRLILTPSKKEDLPELAKLFSDYSVTKYIEIDPLQIYSDSDAKMYLEEFIFDDNTSTYTINRKEDGAKIGQIAYHVHNEEIVELTYWLGKPYQGKGYASEAVVDLSNYIFSNDQNLKFLYIEFIKENVCSKLLAIKIVSNILEKNPDCKVKAIPDKSIKMKIINVFESYVELEKRSENFSNKAVTITKELRFFPQEYIQCKEEFDRSESFLCVFKD